MESCFRPNVYNALRFDLKRLQNQTNLFHSYATVHYEVFLLLSFQVSFRFLNLWPQICPTTPRIDIEEEKESTLTY